MMEVNWIAIIISTVIAMAVGTFWYSPVGFGKQWMKLIGMTKEKMDGSKANMPVIYGAQIVASIVTAYVLSQIIAFAGITDFIGGAIVGFWVWLGFVATVMLGGVLYEGRSLNLYWLNVGYQLVVFVLMGAVLGGL